jgi:hypothetical protein
VRAEVPPSLLGVTVRRAFTVGRFFLGYGIVVSVLLAVGLGLSAGMADTAFPFLLPIFAVTGSMGALVVFSNDRLKGVLEYLLAYGVSPRSIFVNGLLTSLVLVSVTIVPAVATNLGLGAAHGQPLWSAPAQLLVVYGLPMSFASAAFAATIGMFWTSLSSPRSGMNSPIGLAPFLGILPPLGTLAILVVLGISGVYSAASLLIAAAVMVVGVVVIVVGLLGTMERFLRRERLLSPA